MDQIPSNMIDRIEIVRGGWFIVRIICIGGIVNVITKIPKNDGFKLGYDYAVINNKADDKVLYGNATVFSENKNTGAYLFCK